MTEGSNVRLVLGLPVSVLAGGAAVEEDETGGRDVTESPVELLRTLLVLVPLTGGLVGLALIELVLVFTVLVLVFTVFVLVLGPLVLVFTVFVLVLGFLVLVLTFLVLVLGFLVLVLTFFVLVFTFLTVLVFSLVLDVLVFLPPPLDGPLPRLTLPGRAVTTGGEVERMSLADTVTVTVWTLWQNWLLPPRGSAVTKPVA